MNKDKKLKLLKLILNEEHYFLREHQTKVNFYCTLISAIIAAAFAGFFNSEECIHYYALIIAPILIISISVLAVNGTFRSYQSYLEAVTIKAKLEQSLGLTAKNEAADAGDDYWQGEALVPDRHIENRKGSECSKSFIEKYKNEGYQYWTRYLFYLFIVIGILMIAGLLFVGSTCRHDSCNCITYF